MTRAVGMLGVLLLCVLFWSGVLMFAQSEGDYRLRGDAVRPEFANMSGLDADGLAIGFQNVSAFSVRSIGRISPEPVGESTARGDIAREVDDDPLTLKIVFKPPNSTTLALRQGEIHARSPQGAIWPNDTTSRSYLLWTNYTSL